MLLLGDWCAVWSQGRDGRQRSPEVARGRQRSPEEDAKSDDAWSGATLRAEIPGAAQRIIPMRNSLPLSIGPGDKLLVCAATTVCPFYSEEKYVRTAPSKVAQYHPALCAYTLCTNVPTYLYF